MYLVNKPTNNKTAANNNALVPSKNNLRSTSIPALIKKKGINNVFPIKVILFINIPE